MKKFLFLLGILSTSCGETTKHADSSEPDVPGLNAKQAASIPTSFEMTSKATSTFRVDSSTGSIMCTQTKKTDYNASPQYKITNSCLGYENDSKVTSVSDKVMSLDTLTELNHKLSLLDLDLIEEMYTSPGNAAGSADGPTYTILFFSRARTKQVTIDLANPSSLPPPIRDFFLIASGLL